MPRKQPTVALVAVLQGKIQWSTWCMCLHGQRVFLDKWNGQSIADGLRQRRTAAPLGAEEHQSAHLLVVKDPLSLPWPLPPRPCNRRRGSRRSRSVQSCKNKHGTTVGIRSQGIKTKTMVDLNLGTGLQIQRGTREFPIGWAPCLSPFGSKTVHVQSMTWTTRQTTSGASAAAVKTGTKSTTADAVGDPVAAEVVRATTEKGPNSQPRAHFLDLQTRLVRSIRCKAGASLIYLHGRKWCFHQEDQEQETAAAAVVIQDAVEGVNVAVAVVAVATMTAQTSLDGQKMRCG